MSDQTDIDEIFGTPGIKNEAPLPIPSNFYVDTVDNTAPAYPTGAILDSFPPKIINPQLGAQVNLQAQMQANILPPDAPKDSATVEAPKRRGRPPKVRKEEVPCSVCGVLRTVGTECKECFTTPEQNVIQGLASSIGVDLTENPLKETIRSLESSSPSSVLLARALRAAADILDP